MSALLQLHLHSRLNTWLRYIAPRQLQNETRNNKVLRFGVAYIRGLMVLCRTSALRWTPFLCELAYLIVVLHNAQNERRWHFILGMNAMSSCHQNIRIKFNLMSSLWMKLIYKICYGLKKMNSCHRNVRIKFNLMVSLSMKLITKYVMHFFGKMF